MIIVTGAAGFIGSQLVRKLNAEGYKALCIADLWHRDDRLLNEEGLIYDHKIDREDLFSFIDEHQEVIECVFHIGARTDTTEFDKAIFDRLNLEYSKKVWVKCAEYQLPLIYASSAATYGAGEHGYNDDAAIDHLKPLNPYGASKQDFDLWAIHQEKKPFFWAGLKFFNVYGPYENHKGRMASVVWHAYRQIKSTGSMKLFRSHRPDYRDGEQQRDFVYIDDITSVCLFLMENRPQNGIFNLGSGKARTFLDLAHAVFNALNMPEQIEFIDTPADIRDKYQYFTEANMNKLRKAGYEKPFHTLEEGIKKYVDWLENHL